eukprot:2943547-Pyramimonas_sp.AAC.1
MVRIHPERRWWYERSNEQSCNALYFKKEPNATGRLENAAMSLPLGPLCVSRGKKGGCGSKAA